MGGINAALYCRRTTDDGRRTTDDVPLADDRRWTMDDKGQALRTPLSQGRQTAEAIEKVLDDIRACKPLVLPRHLAYTGVMLDDLTSMDHREPYRLMTSRAEHRLLLRSDNADLRLSAIGHALGLVSEERYEAIMRKDNIVRDALARLSEGVVTNAVAVRLSAAGYDAPESGRHTTMLEYARRQSTPYEALNVLLPDLKAVDPLINEAMQQTEIAAKYAGYIVKQEHEVARTRKLEERAIPQEFPFAQIPGLKTEAREKLARFRPSTVGQASRIAGVTPADIAVLLVHLKRMGA
ncbi:MAG TPA: hypothetical protein VJ183_19870 [Chloroflexia bacterium]|nr:hypothetical protein [Chloroflexia bacterium]